MMRTIVVATDQVNYSDVNERFEDGWILDPAIYDGRPLRLDNAVVYHLVKYTEEEREQLEQQPIEYKVISIRNVPTNDADELIQQGYEIADRYAKTVTLIKTEAVKNE